MRHHFLWRFSPSLPGEGQMTVYDRSWYGRLLVERVEDLILDDVVARSTREIVEFEDALTHDGVTLVKFWMHISDEEQLRRFNDRARTPSKQWKLTAEDWRIRSLRDRYLRAAQDMIDETDRTHAHWDLSVES